ncbi:MAG: dipeptide/oligopeptide/nickel ABC transporter permease/ATP-binding protein [Actinomycetota bacterium]
MSDVGQAQAGDRLSGIAAGRLRSSGAFALRGLMSRKTAMVGLIVFSLIVLVAIFAPLVAPRDPLTQDLSKSLLPPMWTDGNSPEHPLGTDAVGRDIASRLIYGARYSLVISVGAALIGSSLGLITGLVAGFFGKWMDSLLMRLGDIQLAFPFILLAIAILGMSPDRTLLKLTLVMGIPGWIIYARVVRSRVLAERSKDYVTAARALGAKSPRLLLRYILPSVWQVVPVIALLDLGYLVIVESTLSFLGFGVPLPRPSWGGILAEGRQFMAVNPWLAILPGAAILVTVLSINLLADGLGDLLNPRASKGRFRRQVLGPQNRVEALDQEAGAAGHSLLRVRNLSVDFPGGDATVHAVRDVTFNVESGETLGIVGESGSGKSVTALALIQLLDPPGRVTAGEILFDGADLTRAAHKTVRELRGKRIAMIFQNPTSSLNPVLTIGFQMTEAIRRNAQVGREAAQRMARESLLSAGIGNPDRVLRQYPFQLSGGMNQRVMIAMSIAVEADLLIADEPTTALDVTTQAQILDEMSKLKDEHNTSLIFITHDIALLSEYADRLLVMYAGKVCEVGSAAEVIADPKHPYTQALIASVPRPEMEGEALHAIGGELADPSSVPEGCPFATRCPEVMDVCWEVDPEHAQIGPGHTAACHLCHESQPEAVRLG